ncbi:hypothetical protein FPV67DRAFT_298498 [Lyophyllum atratum]|nr:hypothetical protein FPV67DRAFT_298498 [Lyophyllum atratum]
MARTEHDNTARVASGSMASYSYEPSPSLIYHPSALPSSSTAPSDLPGFVCNIGPSRNYTQYTTKHHQLDFAPACSFPFPPSPPPTNSDPKRSVPLPSLTYSTADPGPSSHFEGILNLNMPAVTLKHVAPLTPPPTLPTPTLDLPPADNVLSPMPKHDELESSLLCLPSSSRLPDQDHDQDRTVDPLLDPLSPEWSPNNLLPFNCHSHSSSLLYEDHHHHAALETFREYLQHPHSHVNNNTHPPESSSSSSRPILPPLDIPDLHYSPKSTWSESPTSAMEMDVDSDLELDLLPTPISPPGSPAPSFMQRKLDLDLDLDLDEDEDDLMYDEKYQCFPHPSPPAIHQIHFLPSLDEEDIPTSPSLRSFSALPSSSSSMPAASDGDYPTTDMDADMDMDLDPWDTDAMLASPPSPGPTLLSLPGGDTDDDLLPPDPSPPSFPPFPGDDTTTYTTCPSPGSPSRSSLLLLDDVPPPRSPSPDDLDLDPHLLSDPDMRRLCELRQKALAREKEARTLETTLLEKGMVRARWDVRRARKGEKERGREIGEMLRLKVAERGLEGGAVEVVSGSGNGREGKEKGGVGSMKQLVAKMILRRNETCRPLGQRKTPVVHRNDIRTNNNNNHNRWHASSPLARHANLPLPRPFELAGADEAGVAEGEYGGRREYGYGGEPPERGEEEDVPGWTVPAVLPNLHPPKALSSS